MISAFVLGVLASLAAMGVARGFGWVSRKYNLVGHGAVFLLAVSTALANAANWILEKRGTLLLSG